MKLRGILYKKLKEKKKEVEFPPIEIRRPEKPFEFPKIKDLTKVNITYPLLEPFVFVNIRWDEKERALIYRVIEPELSPEEKNMLKKIQDGIIELIEVSLAAIKDTKKLIEYLQEQVGKVIKDLGLKLTQEQYKKLMYYIFRNFAGMSEIEPLLLDPFIEDISCDGVNLPLYIVHRKFGSLKTNLIFPDIDSLRELIIKMAEKCGRYVSYAEPILAGILPDGSRVSATLAPDVATRGGTFTIRKFTERPFSPIDQIELKTASSEVLAYFWHILQNRLSVLVIGGTATGKTSFLNSICMFIPREAKIVSIEDSVTGDAEILWRKNGKFYLTKISELIDPLVKNRDKVENKWNIEVFTLDKGKIKLAKPTTFYKHFVRKEFAEIELASGRKICVTTDHSLFTLNEDGKIAPIKCSKLKVGDFIATPRYLPLVSNGLTFNLIENLKNLKKYFVEGNGIRKLIKNNENFLKKFYSNSGIQHLKRKCFIRADIFKKIKKDGEFFLRSKYGGKFPINLHIDEKFCKIVGLWLANGCYDKNSIIFSVNEEKEEIKKFAKKFNIPWKLHSDGFSIQLNSILAKEIFKEVLNLKDSAYTKRIPSWVFNLREKEKAALISGYFSGDGWIKKHEIAINSSSLGLLKDIQTLLLSFGILLRISKKRLKDKTFEARISGDSLKKFLEIGFLSKEKDKKLRKIASKESFRTVSDIIPLPKHFYRKLKWELGLREKLKKTSFYSWHKKYKYYHIRREYLQNILSNFKVKGNPAKIVKELAFNDVFWDRVKNIRIKFRECYVYDISIPETENFICENVVAHNTRELRLVHEHWVPGLARVGFGMPLPTGEKYGAVSLFDLLKESFRQAPDYVIVGETRGEEAYVMFQGMSAGHPCLSTFHAGSVDTAIKRLTSPPISLSPTLMESLNVIAILAHAKEKGPTARRVKEVVEIVSVDPRTGEVSTNPVFRWNPITDEIEKVGDSVMLRKIAAATGARIEDMEKEIERKKLVLDWLKENNIKDYVEVCDWINRYNKNPEEVLAQIRAMPKVEKIPEKPRERVSFWELLKLIGKGR